VLKPGCWFEITDVETDIKNPGTYTTKMTNEGSWDARLSYACDQHARDLFSIMLSIFGKGLGVKQKDMGKTLNILMEEFNHNRSYIHLHRFCGQKRVEKL
ncbi:2012_t:CDS:2, partial [Racocetra persica]